MTIENLKKLLDKGLDMNHYQVIEFLLTGKTLSGLLEHPRVLVWLNTLQRKSYLFKGEESWDVTEKGRELYLEMTDGGLPAPPVVEMPIGDLHKSLQEKLNSLINKRQVAGFGNVYFIPSYRDLEDFLGRFRRKYPELYNLKKIEACLHKHIENCAKKEKYVPAIKYFIIKEGAGSQLAAALEMYEDSVEEVEKQHQITNTKDLF